MDQENPALHLLRQATAISDQRARTPHEAGEDFNIFLILGAEADEVRTHGRLLHELLSPAGSHGMGTRFLALFFETVLGKKYPKDVTVRVGREIRVAEEEDNYGRMDLVIEGQGFCYPIEIKIHAGDQPRQIERYARHGAGKGDCEVCYLTLDGHAPSPESLGGVAKSSVNCISFGSEIRKWLVQCAQIARSAPSVSEVIRQYIELIDRLTGNMEGDPFMEELKTRVSASDASFESAFAIAKVLPEVQADMMTRVFRELEQHMGAIACPLEKIGSDFERLAHPYYSSRKRVWPSLSYRLAICQDWTVALRFEVEWNLYWGVMFFEGDWQQKPQDAERVAGAFDSAAWRQLVAKAGTRDSWWLWWEYLPHRDATESETDRLLSFRRCTGLYPKLYDPDGHDAIMAQIFDVIDEHVERIRETGLR